MREPAVRDGFTLVELLITIVIVGVLAMIGVSRFWSAKNRGLETTMQADLRAFAVQQESYFNVLHRYASGVSFIDGYAGSPGVQLTVTYAAADGWAGRTTHPSIPTSVCGVYVGAAPAATAAPATTPGIVQCTRE